MQLSVDEVSLAVDDLRHGISAFTALGFEVAETRVDTETASLVLRSSEERAGLRSIGLVCAQPIEAVDDRLPLRFAPPDHREKRPVRHPNGVLRLERVYVVVAELRRAAPEYAAALHMELPTPVRGTVINAMMSVFNLGPVGIVVAEPSEDGPAAEALARQGEGPFQVLFRVQGLENVARWMTQHGLPEPERGTRNTGEAAILVRPQYACGAYVAFVGSATS
jgi:hypothetical protein